MLSPSVLAALVSATPLGVQEAARLDMPLLWTVQTATFLESAPTLADINGDGFDEVLLAAREEIIALDGAGRELWRWRTRGRYYTYPAVLAREGRPARIYAADGTGLLTCLDGSGKVAWQQQLKGGASWCAPVVSDLDHDGRWAVIQGDETGGLTALDAETGAARWQLGLKAAVVSPAVADLDGDGHDEVAASSADGGLSLIGSNGALLWRRQAGGPSPTWATSAPVLFRSSRAHGRVVVGANEGRVTCFDVSGKELWARETSGSVASSLSVGDLDRDGRADVFAITQTGVIYRFDEDGLERWRIDMQGRTIAAGALADLNDDGHIEFTVCTQSGRLMAFDDAGRMQVSRIFDNRTINMTPTLGRLSASRGGLSMVVPGGESGRVFCLGTQAQPASLQWAAYRGDARKTGSWMGLAQAGGAPSRPNSSPIPQQFGDGMAPRAPGPGATATGEPVVFDIGVSDGAKLPLDASAECLRPDGSLQAAVTPVFGTRGELHLNFTVNDAGTYRFSWSARDADGRMLCSGGREVGLEPMATDRVLIQRALDALTSAAGRVADVLPLSGRALQRESEALGARARSQGAPELVRDARRALSVASAVETAVGQGPGASLLAFETAMWDSGSVETLVPVAQAQPLRIARRVVPGEHEPVSVKLFNVTDRPLQVRITARAAPGGPSVTLLRSAEAPTSRGYMAWDALVEMDEAGLLTVPSLQTREVWLDAAFGAVQPGRHTVTLCCQALNGAGVLEGTNGPRDVPAPETVVEMTFDVLPFDGSAIRGLRMCCWASYGPRAVRDLLAHGNDVFCVPQPEPRYDARGRLLGFDCAKLDTMLALLKGHDIVALVQGMPALKPQRGGTAYARELKRWLGALRARMRQFGFTTRAFALYPIDEPGGAGWNAIDTFAEFSRLVKAAAPDIRIYVNGGAEMPMLRKIGPYVDIWCPGLGQLAEASEEMAFIRATGKEIWSYDCGYGFTTAIRAPLKDTVTIAEYRTSALFALRHGGQGIGFWCYNIGPDAWMRVENDYPMVYPGRDKPVTSRRWEAVREGLEDARILMALRSHLADVQDAAVRECIQHLLRVSLPALVDRSHREVLVGLGRSAFAASINERTLREFREEMLDCVAAHAAAAAR